MEKSKCRLWTSQVQSTDKNFLVPVGGAVIAAPKAALVDKAPSELLQPISTGSYDFAFVLRGERPEELLDTRRLKVSTHSEAIVEFLIVEICEFSLRMADFADRDFAV